MARTPMRRRLRFLALVAWGCTALVAHTLPAVAQDTDDGSVPASVSVCFIPGERCFDRIVDAIGAAKTGIRVQAYGFTSTRIIGALAAARRRGVVVEAILDKTNLRQSSGAAYTGDPPAPLRHKAAAGGADAVSAPQHDGKFRLMLGHIPVPS